MDFDAYQVAAQKTDRCPGSFSPAGSSEIVIPLLGLAGETGELLSEYKKHLRDGSSHLLFKERIAEELGDTLWYLANVATKFGLSLGDIAETNLRKTRGRWLDDGHELFSFDDGFLAHERLPRSFECELRQVVVDGREKTRLAIKGKQIGDYLTDNANDPDGYRFHDVFHMAYLAVLGWSPVMRKLLGCKRRSDPRVDEVEDGGRAQVIDEGIAALVFDYAREHRWLEDVTDLDYQLLRTIKGLTSMLEVGVKSMAEWQRAILLGFSVWRQVVKFGGGRILVDLDRREARFLGGLNDEAPQ